MTDSLTEHLVVPVANEADATRTARALQAYEFDQVTVVYVIEHTADAIDILSPEQAREHGQDALEAFRAVIPDAGSETVAAADVVDGVLAVAADVDATAIAFQPRGGSRIVQLLSGDTALRLVTEADRPVIALPGGEEDESEGARGEDT
ncbi:universal stress protein [Halorhabdus salina]|uniref:universal stress protein n=1 Tax=Halorhabdus salina TaxID=2750670 RepID=UPI0015EF9303|nr:universal stress protein [Halorhabdus salina]